MGRAGVTPNRTEDAEEWVKQQRAARGAATGQRSPMQLARCPWCGSEIDGGRDIEVEPRSYRRTL